MATNEMIKKIEELQELEAYIEEVKAEAEAIRDEIKQTMLDQDTEELTAGQYIVRWTSVLDQTASWRVAISMMSRVHVPGNTLFAQAFALSST